MKATIPKGNIGNDQYTVPNDCSCRTYRCCFPLTLANICPWPPAPLFQISLKNSALKTTHNTFRECRLHFLRQTFSKQLYAFTHHDRFTVYFLIKRIDIKGLLQNKTVLIFPTCIQWLNYGRTGEARSDVSM